MRVALAGTTAQSTLQAVLVDAWLPRAAVARPDVPAVNALRYADLLVAADAGARRLAARGARAGDRVGLALPAGEAFAVALHACLRLGAVVVPLDLRLPEAERARRAEGCAVVVEAPLDEGDGDERAPAGGAARPRRARDRRLHERDERRAPSRWPSPTATGSGARSGPRRRSAARPTSAGCARCRSTHVGGLSILLRSAIAATTAVVHERFSTERVLEALAREDGPTVVSLVPTTLARLLDAGLQEPPSLRWALLGGAALPAPLLDRAPGRARAGRGDVRADGGLLAGRHERRAALLHQGRAWRPTARSSSPARRSPPQAAPELATGDLGRWTRDGTPRGRRAQGRHDRHRRRERRADRGRGRPARPSRGGRGRRPRRAHPEWGEAVVATVVLRPGAHVTEAALRAHCAARLAGFQVPKDIAFATALPRTASGKVIRRALR